MLSELGSDGSVTAADRAETLLHSGVERSSVAGACARRAPGLRSSAHGRRSGDDPQGSGAVDEHPLIVQEIMDKRVVLVAAHELADALCDLLLSRAGPELAQRLPAVGKHPLQGIPGALPGRDRVGDPRGNTERLGSRRT